MSSFQTFKVYTKCFQKDNGIFSWQVYFHLGKSNLGLLTQTGKIKQSLKLYTGSVIIAILLVVEKILTRN